MVQSIDAEQAKRMVQEDKILILDVRTPMENIQARIKNSILIPLDQLEARVNEIPRDKPILVYCRSGHRSLMATHILEKHGIKGVYNLSGGIVECPFDCYE